MAQEYEVIGDAPPVEYEVIGDAPTAKIKRKSIREQLLEARAEGEAIDKRKRGWIDPLAAGAELINRSLLPEGTKPGNIVRDLFRPTAYDNFNRQEDDSPDAIREKRAARDFYSGNNRGIVLPSEPFGFTPTAHLPLPLKPFDPVAHPIAEGVAQFADDVVPSLINAPNLLTGGAAVAGNKLAQKALMPLISLTGVSALTGIDPFQALAERFDPETFKDGPRQPGSIERLYDAIKSGDTTSTTKEVGHNALNLLMTALGVPMAAKVGGKVRETFASKKAEPAPAPVVEPTPTPTPEAKGPVVDEAASVIEKFNQMKLEESIRKEEAKKVEDANKIVVATGGVGRTPAQLAAETNQRVLDRMKQDVPDRRDTAAREMELKASERTVKRETKDIIEETEAAPVLPPKEGAKRESRSTFAQPPIIEPPAPAPAPKPPVVIPVKEIVHHEPTIPTAEEIATRKYGPAPTQVINRPSIVLSKKITEEKRPTQGIDRPIIGGENYPVQLPEPITIPREIIKPEPPSPIQSREAIGQPLPTKLAETRPGQSAERGFRQQFVELQQHGFTPQEIHLMDETTRTEIYNSGTKKPQYEGPSPKTKLEDAATKARKGTALHSGIDPLKLRDILRNVVPVLRVNNKDYEGKTHADALAKLPDDLLEEGMKAFADDASHMFKDPRDGKVYTREELGGVHSQDLPVKEGEMHKAVGAPEPTPEDRAKAAEGVATKQGMTMRSGLTEEDIKRAREAFGDRVFVTNTEKELRSSERPLGLSPSKTGEIPVDGLRARLATGSKIEADLLTQAGLDKFLEGRKSVGKEELANWIAENGPKVEVHSYGMEGKVSEAKKEYDRMTHEWLDAKPGPTRTAILRAIDYMDTDRHEQANPLLSQLTDKDVELTRKYAHLRQQIEAEPRDKSLKATQHYSTVSPLPTNEPMPEWTTTKSGKNVQRVDVVIPQKTVTYKPSEGTRAIRRRLLGEDTPETAQGLEQELWQPDNLHENLPNTLGWAMIQYKTGPKGEKIAVIAEAQSRWGQTKQRNKQYEGTLQDPKIPDHPLLRDYNRLILKAAIEQARKEGATHIMVSDSKSALMTEMLDTQYKEFSSKEIAEHEAGKMKAATGDNWNAVEHGGKWYITQHEKGFDFAYDTALPKIAEELAGSKGERVSLGEHKNAYQVPPSEHGNDGVTRKNLIFKNSDGTPKTDVSGLLYDITKPAIRRTVGEPFTMAGKMYSGVPDPIETFRSAKKLTEEPLKNLRTTFLSSQTDKIRRSSDLPKDQASHVADAIDRFDFDQQNLQGAYGAAPAAESLAIIRAEKLTPKEVEEVHKKRHEEDAYGTSNIKLSPAQQKLSNLVDDNYTMIRKDATEKGVRVITPEGMREGGLMKEETGIGYSPAQIDANVANVLVNKKYSTEADYYRKKFNQHYEKVLEPRGFSAEEIAKMAEEDWNARVSAMGGTLKVDETTFKAMNRAEGVGLPWEMVDKNLLNSQYRYGRRAAAHVSKVKNLESDANVAASLNTRLQDGSLAKFDEEHSNWKNIESVDTVQGALRHIYGFDKFSTMGDKYLMEANRAAGNAAMGHLTAAKNLASLPVNMLHKIPIRTLPTFLRSFHDLNGLRTRALKAGSLKHNQASFEAGGDITLSTDRVLNTLIKVNNALAGQVSETAGPVKKVGATLINSRTLSNQFEQLAAHAVGEAWAEGMINSLDSPSVKRMFTDTVKPAFTAEELTTKIADKTKWTEEDIQKIAKAFTDRVVGTRSIRGLPVEALEGSKFGQFATLARWGLEKENVLMKEVVDEARNGNIEPFITHTLTALGVASAVIIPLQNYLRGRKDDIPSVNELKAEFSKEGAAEILVNYMQAAGYFGGMSDYTAAVVNGLSGGDIKSTSRSPLTFILAQDAVNIKNHISNFISSLKDGQSPYDATKNLLQQIGKDNAQNWRILSNLLKDPEKLQKESEERDVRVWKNLAGESEPTVVPYTPYERINFDANEFKESSDFNDAREILTQKIIPRLKEKYSDPQQLISKLQGLATIPDKTIIDPKNNLDQSERFHRFLEDTQGIDEATRRFAAKLGKDPFNPNSNGGYSQKTIVDKMKKLLINAEIKKLGGTPLDEEIPAP